MLIAVTAAYSPSQNVIECVFKNEKFRFVDRLYACEIQNPDDFDDADKEITSVKGSPLRGKSNADVEAIFIRNETMSQFPRNIGSLFPNVKVIAVENVKLEAINKGALETFSSLEYLFLSDNKIKNITDGWLEKNFKIKFISLHGNPITEINPNAFSNLNELTLMDLSGQQCRALTLDRAVNKKNVEKIVSEIEHGGCQENDNLEIIKIITTIRANMTALRVFVIDYLDCKESQPSEEVISKKLHDLEVYKLKMEISKLNNENRQLKRNLMNAEANFDDCKATSATFEAEFEELRNKMLAITQNPNKKATIGEYAFLNELLIMQVNQSKVVVSRKFLLIKKMNRGRDTGILNSF